jgi:hypothetical protein
MYVKLQGLHTSPYRLQVDYKAGGGMTPIGFKVSIPANRVSDFVMNFFIMFWCMLNNWGPVEMSIRVSRTACQILGNPGRGNFCDRGAVASFLFSLAVYAPTGYPPPPLQGVLYNIQIYARFCHNHSGAISRFLYTGI